LADGKLLQEFGIDVRELYSAIESKWRGSTSLSPQPEAWHGLEFVNMTADRELHRSGESCWPMRSKPARARAMAAPHAAHMENEGAGKDQGAEIWRQLNQYF